MDDKMIQNASKMIGESLAGDGDGAPVIWLHGNARREMGKLQPRHADISLLAHSVPSLVECGGIDGAEAALAYLLFAERTRSFLVKIDEIARMSLSHELDLALKKAPDGRLIIFVDQLATALAANQNAAASLLGISKKLAARYDDRVRLVLTDELGCADIADACGAKAIPNGILDIAMELDPLEAVRRETREETIHWMLELLQECGCELPFFKGDRTANATSAAAK